MSDPVRVFMRIPGTQPVPRIMTLLQRVEAAGFDGAGILDSQMISRDTFVVLGQAATSTSRLRLKSLSSKRGCSRTPENRS